MKEQAEQGEIVLATCRAQAKEEDVLDIGDEQGQDTEASQLRAHVICSRTVDVREPGAEGRERHHLLQPERCQADGVE